MHEDTKIVLTSQTENTKCVIAPTAEAHDHVAVRWLLALYLLLPIGSVLLGDSANAQTVVTDGDTLKLNGTIYRLWGIDAPEMKQWCGDYPAGVMASAVLEALMKGKDPVVCEPKGTDRYGRTVAICRVDGRDLGRGMVQLGMAWAFTRYSLNYVQDEAAAKAANLGVHARGCQPAWEWRAAQKR